MSLRNNLISYGGSTVTYKLPLTQLNSLALRIGELKALPELYYK